MEDYYKKNKRPVNNTVKKIMVGKLVTFHSSYRRPLVVIGVRRNPLYGNLQMLLGEYYVGSISVMSWYDYFRNNIMFVGRDTRQAIRKCLKTNPKYIAYHTGKSIDLSKMVLYQGPPLNYVQGTIVIYDNCDYYKNYLETVTI